MFRNDLKWTSMKLNRIPESNVSTKKKRPLERGLGHGSDTVFQYNNSNVFRYLVEGDPGIEPGTFGSGVLVDRLSS